MDQTTNYKLRLYDGTDLFSVTATVNSLNSNMEIIDSAIKNALTKADNAEVTAQSASVAAAKEDLVTDIDSKTDNTKLAYDTDVDEMEVPTIAEFEEYKTEMQSYSYAKDATYNKAEVENKLLGKVDVETGKSLTSNDYTDADKAKVDAMPSITVTEDGYIKIQY